MRRLLGCITTYTAGPNGARVITLFVNSDCMGSLPVSLTPATAVARSQGVDDSHVCRTQMIQIAYSLYYLDYTYKFLVSHPPLAEPPVEV
jgi:hypothetical protein